MTNKKLGLDYYKRAFIRFKLVIFFMKEEDYADVVKNLSGSCRTLSKGNTYNDWD